VQSVIVLVDLLSLAQQPIPAPEGRLLRPLAWTEDNSAILFADSVEGSTWKVSVRSGELEKVANGVYLGTLAGGA
jgi:hypothetical protein